MKKTYKVEIDCPTCGSKLEKCVLDQPGVEGCKINFLTQKLVIDAPAEDQERIISDVISKMKKIDDDIVIHG